MTTKRTKLLDQINMVEAVTVALAAMEAGVALVEGLEAVSVEEVMEAGEVSEVDSEGDADGDVAEADSTEEAADSAVAAPLKHKLTAKLMKPTLEQLYRYINMYTMHVA
ncbi:hypothetical protein ACET3Z_020619 [Daucus carota]